MWRVERGQGWNDEDRLPKARARHRDGEAYFSGSRSIPRREIPNVGMASRLSVIVNSHCLVTVENIKNLTF